MLLALIPFLVGCGMSKKPEDDNDVVVPEITCHDYFEVADKTITWQKAFDVDLPDYFIYCYSPTCSHCSEIKDLMIETALSRDNVFFIIFLLKKVLNRTRNRVRFFGVLATKINRPSGCMASRRYRFVYCVTLRSGIPSSQLLFRSQLIYHRQIHLSNISS